MLYQAIERAILERFRGKPSPMGETGPNPPIKRRVDAEDEAPINVAIHFKKGNKEKINIPCIIIDFSGEDMRQESTRGSTLNTPVGTDADSGQVDTVWSAPHPDPCDVNYDFLVYGRNRTECEYIMSDIKRLFPQRWHLWVAYRDNDRSRLDMLRTRGPGIKREGDLTLESNTILDEGLEVWTISYVVEGYDENVTDRKYETNIARVYTNYQYNGTDIPGYELDES